MRGSAVAVAQLVESQIVILVVVGSSPISHPTKFNNLGAIAGCAYSAEIPTVGIHSARRFTSRFRS
jgi:hypothetical protein